MNVINDYAIPHKCEGFLSNKCDDNLVLLCEYDDQIHLMNETTAYLYENIDGKTKIEDLINGLILFSNAIPENFKEIEQDCIEWLTEMVSKKVLFINEI